MPAVDFITALGRVLQNGALRDAFARDAGAFVKAINLRESDRSVFLRLSPTELEEHARVLLRKRFDPVRKLLPQTCQTLGKSAWDYFALSVRSCEMRGPHTTVQDAYRFCTHVAPYISMAYVFGNSIAVGSPTAITALHFISSKKAAGCQRFNC